MIDPHSISFTYFETDQIKFAVQLCKMIKKSGGAEFDVLKFTKDWEYADAILSRAMMANDEPVSDGAIELTQLRAHFMQQFPERARKLGALIAIANPQATPPAPVAATAPVRSTSGNKDGSDSDSSNVQYLKGLR